MQCYVMLCHIMSCMRVCMWVCIYVYDTIYVHNTTRLYIYIHILCLYKYICTYVCIYIIYIYYRDWLRTVHI